MPLFSISNSAVKKIPPTKFGLEKGVQQLFEKNLSEILSITFIASEHPTNTGGRIDTLGIDNNGSPVIIEYKRTHNDAVINQGLFYLNWLIGHRGDFEILKQNAGIRTETDWESPRVICVAESYNKFDLEIIDLLPTVELLRYRLYSDNILLVESESRQRSKTSPSAAPLGTNTHRHAPRGHPAYTVAAHLASANPPVRELFAALRERIMALDDTVTEEPKKHYLAYKLVNNFVDITVQKDSLKIFLNISSGKLADPAGIARDLTKPKPVGHWGNGDYEVKLGRPEDIDATMALINQSYNYNR